MNESFSDIFGETVDLLNASGTDTPAVRWLMGEDIPGIGAIRNMANPIAFGDPGKTSDTQFVCSGIEYDNGGVHINSGVPNHAYALMVDGGTYNGITVNPIGLTKAGKIQYRVLTRYLTSGSNFLDYYHALQQACTDLVGTAGITDNDCVQVRKALDAAEMSQTPCDMPQEPALCPSGQAPINLFYDDLEDLGAAGNWRNRVISGLNHWNEGGGTPDVYWSGYATSGQRLFWGYDYNYIGDSTVEMTGDVAIPAGGTTYLQFDHSFEFEYYYDGGVLEYSTNGGTSWSDAGGLITAGAQYNGSLSTYYSNLLGGRDAFVRDSYGYTATRLNLLSLAGSNFRLRFRIGTDSSVSHFGWFIDNVRIYQCVNRSDKIGIWRKENDRFAKFYFDFNGSGGWDGGDTASGPMGWNVNGIWDTLVVGRW